MKVKHGLLLLSDDGEDPTVRYYPRSQITSIEIVNVATTVGFSDPVRLTGKVYLAGQTEPLTTPRDSHGIEVITKVTEVVST